MSILQPPPQQIFRRGAILIQVLLPNNRSYPIFLNDSTPFVNKLTELAPASRYVVITNNTLADMYADQLKQWESDLPGLLSVVVEDGEEHKNMATILFMLDEMLHAKCDRKTVVIAFGGGVIGDMAGFAASLLLRGVDFVQVPTTLLAMVDSSVGGKTGVNHAMGKNLIGAFYQPVFVWIDTEYLDTLPSREFEAGCGEIAKYGYIGGEAMFHFVEGSFSALLERDVTAVECAIRHSVEIKAAVVAEDEREQGKRALLNFGHTFGHALEHFFHYKGILHGEGVLWGIYCAVELAIEAGLVDKPTGTRLRESLDMLTLPRLSEAPDIEALYAAMFSDKKTKKGTINFIVPVGIGESIISSEFSEEQVLAVMNRIFCL